MCTYFRSCLSSSKCSCDKSSASTTSAFFLNRRFVKHVHGSVALLLVTGTIVLNGDLIGHSIHVRGLKALLLDMWPLFLNRGLIKHTACSHRPWTLRHGVGLIPGSFGEGDDY